MGLAASHDGFCASCGRPSMTDLCACCQHRAIDGPDVINVPSAYIMRVRRAAYECPDCGLMTLVWYDHLGRQGAAIPTTIKCRACGHEPEVETITERVTVAEEL